MLNWSSYSSITSLTIEVDIINIEWGEGGRGGRVTYHGKTCVVPPILAGIVDYCKLSDDASHFSCN
jgi:hypothetical protein